MSSKSVWFPRQAGALVPLAFPEPSPVVNGAISAGGVPAKKSATTPVRAPAAPPWYLRPRNLRVTGVALTTATASSSAVFLVRALYLNRNLNELGDALRDRGWPPSRCLQQPPPECAELRDLQKGRDLFADLGVGTLIASGILGGATAALYFTDFSFLRSEPTKDGFQVVPVTTGQQTGLLIHGVW
jgi:hypothetical protein